MVRPMSLPLMTAPTRQPVLSRFAPPCGAAGVETITQTIQLPTSLQSRLAPRPNRCWRHSLKPKRENYSLVAITIPPIGAIELDHPVMVGTSINTSATTCGPDHRSRDDNSAGLPASAGRGLFTRNSDAVVGTMLIAQYASVQSALVAAKRDIQQALQSGRTFLVTECLATE